MTVGAALKWRTPNLALMISPTDEQAQMATGHLDGEWTVLGSSAVTIRRTVIETVGDDHSTLSAS